MISGPEENRSAGEILKWVTKITNAGYYERIKLGDEAIYYHSMEQLDHGAAFVELTDLFFRALCIIFGRHLSERS